MKLNSKKSLSLFVTAGFPTVQTTVPLVIALANSGADLIELGVPFSDPVADGPVIQHSSEIALKNGVTLRSTFEMVKEIRKHTAIPVVMMGYANTFYAYGMERFFSDCQQFGINGTIIVDLSLEESGEYISLAKKSTIDTIFLATPTTPNERLKQLDESSTGFLYCVSITGVTGERKNISEQAKSFLQRAKANVTKNPLLVGFGISTPDDANEMAQYADGVIIGSALVKILLNANPEERINEAVKFVKSVRQRLDSIS